MRVLITGGAGYIGSHTARELARQGHEPIVFDNLSTGHREFAEKFAFIEGDIRHANQVTAALRGVDAVIHLAAKAYVGESFREPRKYYDNNVLGGLALLDAAVDAGVRNFIFSSSCTVYGLPNNLPIDELHRRQPMSPYGRTKLGLEMALEDYARAYGLWFATLRYFNAAGADESGELGEWHDPETHILPLALLAAADQRPLQIFGTDYPTADGTCIRDYVHVSDLAAAHIRALDYITSNRRSLTVNLGTGTGHSVKEVVATVERITGRRVTITEAPRREGDPPVLVADPSLASSLLRWRAERPLTDVVATAWSWFQRRL